MSASPCPLLWWKRDREREEMRDERRGEERRRERRYEEKREEMRDGECRRREPAAGTKRIHMANSHRTVAVYTPVLLPQVPGGGRQAVASQPD